MNVENKSDRVRLRRRIKRQVATKLKISKRELQWENGKLCLGKTPIQTIEIHRSGPKRLRSGKNRNWKKMKPVHSQAN